MRITIEKKELAKAMQKYNADLLTHPNDYGKIENTESCAEQQVETLLSYVSEGHLEEVNTETLTVFTKDNVIAAVKDIRKEEDHHNDQAIFCNEHNFKLEETLHRQIENKLRRICHQLQNRFELGYISR